MLSFQGQHFLGAQHGKGQHAFTWGKTGGGEVLPPSLPFSISPLDIYLDYCMPGTVPGARYTVVRAMVPAFMEHAVYQRRQTTEKK